MKPLQNDYLERVYAGVLGKTIGVRHGSNDEGWSYEKIKEVYGEVTDYLYDFKNFAADDDTNGTFLLLKALTDYQCSKDITSQNIADTLLNYAPDHHGFFWWGPYGVSTECTAYTNLKAGARPPLSGSVELNGATIAEQIGGQIFIDGWGLVAPANEQLAADFASKAACVTHGGNGVYGGMFVAAAVSAAFDAKDIYEVLRRALAVIPEDCTYAQMVRDIWKFYDENPSDWRSCLWHIRANWWQDRYPGNCHIMPNAAIMMLSMLYGAGDFSDTINICNMCGWDTDCNVANVGTILAVLVGLDGIDCKWRKPIGDLIVFSSVLGDVNIDNLAQVAYDIASMGYRINEQQVPQQLAKMVSRDALRFDFSLPGSTQAFRTLVDEDDAASLVQTTDCFATGNGSLKLVAATQSAAAPVKAYYQTYYRPDDFNDSRYDPSFAPVAYPGQSIRAVVQTPKATSARMYWKDGNSGTFHYGDAFQLKGQAWTEISMRIAQGNGVLVAQVGVELMSADHVAVAYIDAFTVEGKADYVLDFGQERMEHWNNMHEEVSQFEYNVGNWRLENGKMAGHGAQLAQTFTGSTRWKDVEVETVLTPITGGGHNLEFRVQGALRSYAAGLAKGGKLKLYKKYLEYQTLAETDFNWEMGKSYEIKVIAAGNNIQVYANGCKMIEFVDETNPYLTGCVGASIMDMGHCTFDYIKVEEK